MGICAGIDLCDDHIAIRICGETEVTVWPAVVCREKKGEHWFVGEEAYRVALSGEGVMTDKLLKLLSKNGTSTVMRRQYTGSELLTELFRKVLEEKTSVTDFSCIDRLCVTLHKPDGQLFDKVKASLAAAGVAEEKLLLISHEEAFIYYTLSQEKDLYSGLVGAFDLSEERLCFYELMMVRGMSRPCVVAESRDVEEAFHTDILRKDSGRTLGDRIITDVAKRSMEGKAYSAVFLTGTGFDRIDWAQNFVSYVCLRRKVLQEKGLFAIGAAFAADDSLRAETQFPELMFCDGRTTSEISMNVSIHERTSRLMLTRAGSRWYGLGAHIEVIPEEGTRVSFLVEPFDKTKEKREVTASLGDVTEIALRPEKCTRVAVDMRFSSADRVELKLTDLGFGEICPASGTEVQEELSL